MEIEVIESIEAHLDHYCCHHGKRIDFKDYYDENTDRYANYRDQRCLLLPPPPFLEFAFSFIHSDSRSALHQGVIFNQVSPDLLAVIAVIVFLRNQDITLKGYKGFKLWIVNRNISLFLVYCYPSELSITRFSLILQIFMTSV